MGKPKDGIPVVNDHHGQKDDAKRKAEQEIERHQWLMNDVCQPHKKPDKHGDHHPQGMDISHHQNIIDWKQVKEKGHIDFAYMKATEGTDFLDDRFAYNWKAAREAHVIRGAYHFFRPKSSVDEQVKEFVKAVKKLEPGDLPPALDLEEPEHWKHNRKQRKQNVDHIIDWLDQVNKKLGMKPVIYATSSFVEEVLGNDKRLAHYGLWLAQYRAECSKIPRPFKHPTFWQYSERGKVQGVGLEKGAPSVDVDKDEFYGKPEELDKLRKQPPKKSKHK